MNMKIIWKWAQRNFIRWQNKYLRLEHDCICSTLYKHILYKLGTLKWPGMAWIMIWLHNYYKFTKINYKFTYYLFPHNRCTLCYMPTLIKLLKHHQIQCRGFFFYLVAKSQFIQSIYNLYDQLCMHYKHLNLVEFCVMKIWTKHDLMLCNFV